MLNDPGGATTSPSGSSTAATRSLVEVFPDEPVIPMIVSPPATSSAATALASLASAASTAAPEPSASCSSTPASAPPVERGLGLDHDGGDPDRPGRQHRHRAGRHRRGRVVMSVGARSRQRQEQPARTDGPRVELDGPGDAEFRGGLRRDVGQRAADDLGDLGDGQIDHRRACRASSARASSTRSSNGRTSPAAALPGFVAFAGDQHHVARAGPRHRVPDRRAAVGDLDHLRRLRRPAAGPGQDLAADRRGILAARVVVGDDDQIGQLGGDPAHRRPLAGVALATGAEHHRQPAVRPQQGGQHRAQRARLVGVVDQREKILAAVDLFQPPGDTGLQQSRRGLLG